MEQIIMLQAFLPLLGPYYKNESKGICFPRQGVGNSWYEKEDCKI